MLCDAIQKEVKYTCHNHLCLNKTCCKSSVKLKASRREFTAEKKPCILDCFSDEPCILDCFSDEYFIILCYLKPEKCKYIFSNNQLLRILNSM